MVRKENETFKGHAQCWMEITAQVQPPLSKKELVTTFIDILQSPFYDKMIGNVSPNFSNLVIIRERVEMGMRSGRIALRIATTNANKHLRSTNKRKEGETNTIASTPNLPNQNHITYYQPQSTYHPQVTTISQSTYHQSSQPRMTFQPPLLQPLQPPYPKNYDLNAKCDYHASTIACKDNEGDP
ncbi:hypothetical protein CR513_07906, partial [Mucuna pruriens]